MSDIPPSIFNDVLGPVMRGPSSSHSAAANRIGRIARDLVGEPIKKLIAKYDPNGSLVTTHKDQGTDMGLYSGILGWSPDDDRMTEFETALKDEGIEVEVRYESYDAPHPNFYRLELESAAGRIDTLDAISTGGGMIELKAIDGVDMGGLGDLNYILLWCDEEPVGFQEEAESSKWLPRKSGGGIFRIETRRSYSDEDLATLTEQTRARRVRFLKAVLPVLSRANLSVPFLRCGELENHSEFQEKPLWEAAAAYEAERGGISIEEVLHQMKALSKIMSAAIDTGLKGTTYADRILPSQSPGMLKAEEEGRLVPAGINNRIIRYVSAIMEVKSSMGVIVAAPTAGSCGAMPGAVLAVADSLGSSEEERAQALLVAGLIGVFITLDATFAAEEGGCMAECGSGSAMAAAAIVHLAGGSRTHQITAASIALQNSFGLVCDPIANRVEAPCLGKNVMAATNALSCANMALAGYDHLIPFDEVVLAMNKVAHQIPRELRCTNLGGLSITPTAGKIAERLKQCSSPCGCALIEVAQSAPTSPV
ncbi:L-serine ammonia-lyase, iron-sulfur-dependent, subunit alpha [Akkermansiaceae bacterium]|nr:L-serine ammonia-lyase, iron-sulfur-dependent, subunit alpha [Akkermansiaceae bacterium]